MKKICLKGISEILSERELKNIMGGSSCDGYFVYCNGKYWSCLPNSYGLCVNSYCTGSCYKIS